jgi:hypothetical protein
MVRSIAEEKSLKLSCFELVHELMFLFVQGAQLTEKFGRLRTLFRRQRRDLLLRKFDFLSQHLTVQLLERRLIGGRVVTCDQIIDQLLPRGMNLLMEAHESGALSGHQGVQLLPLLRLHDRADLRRQKSAVTVPAMLVSVCDAGHQQRQSQSDSESKMIPFSNHLLLLHFELLFSGVSNPNSYSVGSSDTAISE